MFSVIIPAFNEEAVIGRCLATLLEGAEPAAMEIVVVPNGCTDRTADVARAFGPSVIVAETPVPSKWQALNLGDRVASGFPRLYVDADVGFSFQDARAVATALEEGALAASPSLDLDTSEASFLVRSHLRIWERLPVIARGLMGRGVYGLSAAGRARFGEFPDLIADDHFVHGLFEAEERTLVDVARSTVRAPRRLHDLIQRKVRSYVGLWESQQRNESVDGDTSREWLGVVRAHPALLKDLPTYLGVSLAARFLARRRIAAGRAHEWDRDLSSRTQDGD